MTLRVGCIGAGGIARALDAYARRTRKFDLVALLSRAIDRDAAHWPRDVLVADRAALLSRAPDLVVECAGHEAVRQHVPALLEAGIDVILASAGSLADAALLDRLLAISGRARLIVPAGALAGIDGLAAASRDELSAVRLTTAKPPLAWQGTAAEKAVDLAKLATAHTFFSGTAREAARLYPRNANVAATVALAGIGFDRTRVDLIADPQASANTHRIEATGSFGRFSVEIAGEVSPSNPRTSRLTAFSIIRAIELRAASFVI